MRFKWWKFISPISLPPRDGKSLAIWLIFKLLYWVIGPWGFLILAVSFVAVTFFAFLLGNVTGSTNGTYDTQSNTITLSKKAQAKNTSIEQKAITAANTWQSGLTNEQIQQVSTNQVDIPSALLLSIGKMVDNEQNTNFGRYYTYFKPTYHFKTFTTTVQTWREVTQSYTVTVSVKKKGKWIKKQERQSRQVCQESTQTQTHSLLTYAKTWDGTLSLTYKQVAGGSKGCPNGSWSTTWKIASMQRTYSWSQVWNLFDHIKTQQGWMRQSTANEQFLAGFLAMSDPALDDPNVQQMVANLSFLSGGSITAFSGTANVGVASTDVVKNVVRWKSYIYYYAKVYQVPAVLIAAQMAQESGGRQHFADGSLKVSGIGTGNAIDAATGAIGLMQVEPSTASGLTIVLPTGQTKYVGNDWYAILANPVTNISAGADYIANLYHEFGSNMTQELGAYNGGPGAEQTALAQGYPIPQFGQTQGYVAAIEQTWVPALTPYFSSSGTSQA